MRNVRVFASKYARQTKSLDIGINVYNINLHNWVRALIVNTTNIYHLVINLH